MLHKPFELDLESEYETSSIFIRDKLLQGKRFRDDRQMEGIGGDTVNSYLMMNSLEFIVFPDNYSIQPFSAFAFSHLITEPKYSLIHYFYQNKTIDKRQFSLYRQIRYNNTLVYFDQIDKEVIDNMYQIEVPINKDSKYWEFKLQKICITKGKCYDNTYSSHFVSTFKHILVPPNLYQFFLTYYLKEYIDNGKCKEREGIINCDRETTKEFPTISLVIEGKVFELNRTVLFGDDEEEEGYFLFRKSSKESLSASVLVSIDSIWENVVTFDYEKDKMIFYTKTELVDFSSSKGEVKVILLLVIAICIIQSIMSSLYIIKGISI